MYEISPQKCKERKALNKQGQHCWPWIQLLKFYSGYNNGTISSATMMRIFIMGLIAQ
jgi:hypothetical protein